MSGGAKIGPLKARLYVRRWAIPLLLLSALMPCRFTRWLGGLAIRVEFGE